jgi:guanylate cyclase soluble subunit beta
LLLQTVASKLHGTEVEVKILKTKEECDHVQFLITELSGPGKASRPEAAQIETLSIGNLQEVLIKHTLK